jgi:hypothetical protein
MNLLSILEEHEFRMCGHGGSLQNTSNRQPDATASDAMTLKMDSLAIVVCTGCQGLAKEMFSVHVQTDHWCIDLVY